MTLATALRLLPYAIILALILAVGIQRSHINSLGHKLDSERAGRIADRQSYQRAQDEAKAKMKAEIERIRRQQESISNETIGDLNSRLERIRRELRPQNPAAPGAPKGPGAGGSGQAPGGADGEAGLCLSPEERLRAAEDEERHDQLITWVERQSRVRP